MFSRIRTGKSMSGCSGQIERLRRALREAEAVAVGAGAGLSAAAGFAYSGERFWRYFGDFGERYGIRDMYSGGFYPFPSREEFWTYWSRYLYLNRYQDAPVPVYEELRELLAGKDYFVLTTNVDHCFQKAGFDRKRLFYTQGDYGLSSAAGPAARRPSATRKPSGRWYSPRASAWGRLESCWRRRAVPPPWRCRRSCCRSAPTAAGR